MGSDIIGSTSSKHVCSTETITSIRYFLVLGMIVNTLALGFLMHSIEPTSPSPKFSHPKQECGNTTTEARKKGCEFDLLSYSWIPPDCYDRETAGEFRRWVNDPDRERGSWPLFEDRQLKQRIADENDLSERIGIWTWVTEEIHLGHCAFLARRLHRAIEGKFRLTGVENINHTLHCTNQVLDNLSNSPSLHSTESGISRLTVNFVPCY
jgi:hypothetical protein